MCLSRRAMLTAAGFAALSFPSFAFGQTPRRALFVLIILRGGMDGLGAAPAIGDPLFAQAREGLAPPATGDGAPLPLDGFFGLHPALLETHRLYAARQALIVHAVGTAYRERSHFDAQNSLEIGLATPHGRDTGWLNAALGALPGGEGLSVGVATPLALRGPAPTSSWSPSVLEAPEEGTVARLQALYAAQDPALAAALRAGAETAMTAEDLAMGAGRGRNLAPLARAAGRFLRDPEGPMAAVLELGGWDTHAAQATALGPFSRALRSLDGGVLALREALGTAWDDTVVAVVTEFGRTVGMNGAGGSDHGQGSAMFLLGGAVAGGRVLADWPGLGRSALAEGRDLAVTTAMNDVLAGVLADHLNVSSRALSEAVFPDAGLRPVSGLIRG
jgi:uncharacterized protein (DUF1501 family)